MSYTYVGQKKKVENTSENTVALMDYHYLRSRSSIKTSRRRWQLKCLQLSFKDRFIGTVKLISGGRSFTLLATFQAPRNRLLRLVPTLDTIYNGNSDRVLKVKIETNWLKNVEVHSTFDFKEKTFPRVYSLASFYEDKRV
ncbi:hypothetical protein V1478_008723 [Vespula squamosa]|uniref:Uncharacterized protein n=1 Tax=Vespula squamosa TaxID=30214 RepID=A0ABD2AWB3_VESSQ